MWTGDCSAGKSQAHGIQALRSVPNKSTVKVNEPGEVQQRVRKLMAGNLFFRQRTAFAELGATLCKESQNPYLHCERRATLQSLRNLQARLASKARDKQKSWRRRRTANNPLKSSSSSWCNALLACANASRVPPFVCAALPGTRQQFCQ